MNPPRDQGASGEAGVQRSLEFVSFLKEGIDGNGYFFQGVLEVGDSRGWGPYGQARQGTQWRASQRWVGGAVGLGLGSTASRASLCY